jgi:hypothetical protein
MNIKAAVFVAILVAAAAFAPTASADSQTAVLDVKGTDYAANIFFGGGDGEIRVQLPLQLGTVALFGDVVTAAPLGTVTFSNFDDGILQETFSFTNAVADSFQIQFDGFGLPIDVVGFKFNKVIITTPSTPPTPSPEPSSLALLAMGIFCAAGVWMRREALTAK